MAPSHSPSLEKLAILLLDSNRKRGLTAIGLLWPDISEARGTGMGSTAIGLFWPDISEAVMSE